MRSRREVIGTILANMGTTDHVGLAVEPIGISEDPDNKTEADYVIRACVPVVVKDRPDAFFVVVFQAAFCMERLRRIDQERFERCMDQIIEEIEGLQADVASGKKPSMSAETGQLFNMGRVVNKGYDKWAVKSAAEEDS